MSNDTSGNQFRLFTSRRFTPMFLTQFLGAFNDNVFKQGLILVLTFTAAAKLGVSASLLTNAAALLFVLPFFLLSALAGQIADKYEKSHLTHYIKLLEIGIMLLAAVGFMLELYSLLFVALFLMGVHSTFFGPIKYAYLPQAMHDNELVGANGLFQMGTSLAILTGMILAGVLVQQANPMLALSVTVIVIAGLGYFASRFIPALPVIPSEQSDSPVDWNIFRTSWATIKYLYSIPLLFVTILGNSWFWFYGSTFLIQMAEFGKSVLHGNESVVIFLLTLFSVGTALGSMLCKSLTKNQVSLKLLPFGIAGLTIFAVDLYFALHGLALPHLAEKTDVLTLAQLWQLPSVWRVFADLFLLGFAGGIYIVPLYAFMQAYSPEAHRARIIGANNIFNALFMVSSAVFSIICLSMLKLGLAELFAITGVLNLAVGVLIYTKLKKHSQGMTPYTK